MDREQYLRMQLAELEAIYRRDAKPIMDELIEIQKMKPPAPIVFPAAELPDFLQEQVTRWNRSAALDELGRMDGGLLDKEPGL